MKALGSPSISRARLAGTMLSEYRKLVYADDKYSDNILSFAYLKSILLLKDFFLKFFYHLCDFFFVSFLFSFFFFFFTNRSNKHIILSSFFFFFFQIIP